MALVHSLLLLPPVLLPLLLLLLAPAAMVEAAKGDFPIASAVQLYSYSRFRGEQKVIYPTPEAPCTNLGAFAGKARSGRFTWSFWPTQKRTVCKYVWFYPNDNCQGQPSGVPASDDLAKRTDIGNFVLAGRTAITTARSVGCSFSPDPCVGFGCEDPTAVCNSSLGWSFKGVASQTLQCTCPAGHAYVNGKCTDVCTPLDCPYGSTCVVTGASGECTCPEGFEIVRYLEYDDVYWRGCSYKNNYVREFMGQMDDARKGPGFKRMYWNLELSYKSSAWAYALASSSCKNASLDPNLKSQKFGKQTQVTLVAPYTDRTKAVAAWMAERVNLNPTDPTKCLKPGDACINVMKIMHPNNTYVGCATATVKAKGSCYGYTKYVCTFTDSPYIYD